VTQGAVIGAVGDTAIGEIREVAHLHFEMTLHGEHVNPTGFLPNR
jgi:murein DD-endopeptidase MepM/ murein hydrolase activator NlpD